jgi:GMP synthase (glutamine-hydrolysing)
MALKKAKKILILKTGNTIIDLLDRGRDFEQFFITVSGLDASLFTCQSLHLHDELVDLKNIAGIIITGSPAYVTDQASWNFIGAEYIRKAHSDGIPILGVCYGHQLVAWAFGGEVAFNPKGREIGTVIVSKTEAAIDDALFYSLPETFKVQVSHQQSVTRLPKDAVRLAYNNFEINHAFRLGAKTWGVQFHPEFSAETIRAYIESRQDCLTNEGLNVDSLLDSAEVTNISSGLVRKFCSIALIN